MRKLAAAILAVPIIVVLYIPLIARRSVASRAALLLGIVAFTGLGLLNFSGPTGTTATPPSNAVPVTSAAVRTDLRVGQAPNAAISIAFSTPMNPASVAGSLRIEPAADVATSWDAGRTLLTLTPRALWRTGTFYTVTVQSGALAESGRPLSRPVLAAFLVRDAAAVRFGATKAAKGRAALDSGFSVTFDRPVSASAVAAAVWIRPAVAGTLLPVGRRGAPRTFVFQPASPLKPNTTYRIALKGGVVDSDGAAVPRSASTAIKTVGAPWVVRFRPARLAKDVARSATLSVRFSEPMDRASTKAAFHVTANGTRIGGRISFAENDTVLIFDTRHALGYHRRVRMSVGAGATSAAGVRLGKAVRSSFLTVAQAVTPSKSSAPIQHSSSSGGGGGAVGGGSWAAVESYYLRLMNCTRTGGWVTSSGSCSSPGGSGIAPLRLDSGISSRVSRPYARYLATHNACNHFINGNPGDRLRRAGYTSYVWAENLGCRSGNPYSAVLGSHLFFQSEKSYSGGHYVNMMNRKYDRAGIGVWVYAGRVRLVVDFYHPL